MATSLKPGFPGKNNENYGKVSQNGYSLIPIQKGG